MGTVEPQVATAKADVKSPDSQAQLIDGFQLVIDALKLNGLDTIYGLPGIPITDLTRRAQAAGMRVLSFRHEQSAGYAASIAGLMLTTEVLISEFQEDNKPGVASGGTST